MDQDKIQKIRFFVHEIKNKAGIIAGYSELYYKMPEVKKYASMTQGELLKEHLDLLEKFKPLREQALGIDTLLSDLKTLIYKELGVDGSDGKSHPKS